MSLSVTVPDTCTSTERPLAAASGVTDSVTVIGDAVESNHRPSSGATSIAARRLRLRPAFRDPKPVPFLVKRVNIFTSRCGSNECSAPAAIHQPQFTPRRGYARKSGADCAATLSVRQGTKQGPGGGGTFFPGGGPAPRSADPGFVVWATQSESGRQLRETKTSAARHPPKLSKARTGLCLFGWFPLPVGSLAYGSPFKVANHSVVWRPGEARASPVFIKPINYIS